MCETGDDFQNVPTKKAWTGLKHCLEGHPKLGEKSKPKQNWDNLSP